MIETVVDPYGKEVGRFFQHKGEKIGLTDESHEKFLKVVGIIQRTPSFRETLSEGSLREVAFRWLQTKYEGGQASSLSDHIIERCSAMIDEHQAWVPIAHLKLQSPLEFGLVTFRPVTKEMIDEWTGEQRQSDSSHVHAKNARSERLRQELQSYASAVTAVTAERERAIEIATERADYAISMLRLFHPATIFPDPVAYCDLLGSEHIKSTMALTFSANAPPRNHRKAVSLMPPDWELPASHVANLANAGVRSLNKLMRVQTPTEFERTLCESLLIYSRVSLCTDLSDKLIYLFTAVERFLLKNETETLGASISARLAWIVGETVNQRLDIMRNVKEVYGIRSRLLHHGRKVKEKQKLKPFMFSVWAMFIRLIRNEWEFKTRDEMFSAIEHWTMGGT